MENAIGTGIGEPADSPPTEDSQESPPPRHTDIKRHGFFNSFRVRVRG